MAELSPQQIAQNWVSGMANATEKIRQGVQAVTESPTAKAARAIPRMVQGIQQAAASGKIEAALLRVSNEDWKQATLQKGVGRIAAGAAAAQPKFAQFMSEFMPYVRQGVDQINRTTPRGSTEQNIARVVAMIRHNAQFKRSRA